MKLMIDIDAVGGNDVVMGYIPVSKALLMEGSAEEVILCKDCKYSSSNGLYGCRLEHFELETDHIGRLLPTNGARMYAEDFCSRGVRRGEEDE